jgi:hypothetical protein
LRYLAEILRYLAEILRYLAEILRYPPPDPVAGQVGRGGAGLVGGGSGWPVRRCYVALRTWQSY